MTTDYVGERPASRSLAIVSSQAFSIANFRGPLTRDIVAAGYTVYAIAPDFEEDTRRAVIELGARPVTCHMARTGLNVFADLLFMLRLALVLRRLNVDVVLAYFVKPVIFGTIAAWIARVPKRFALIAGLGYVFVEDDDKTLAKRLLRRGVSLLYRVALRRTEIVFFQNQQDLSEFAAAGIIEASRGINTLGTGVDLTEWQPSQSVVEPMTFLLAARLLREKGIPEFAEAARLIKKRHPSVRFVLLGAPDSNPGGLSIDEVNSWVGEGLLEWHGHVPVAPWLQRTSVYVLPSYYREGVPRSIQEAMAMGRPIVTTSVVGCRETVIHGSNGFLVPPRDVPKLAEALQKFIDDPTLVESMGRASRKLAEERFDVRRVNAVMIDAMKLIPSQELDSRSQPG